MSLLTRTRSPRVAATTTGRRRRLGGRRQAVWATVFLAPAIVAIVVLRIAPTIAAINSSLFQGFPGGIIEATFAGFANYQELFSDPSFIAMIWRTIGFNLIINPLQVIVALLISVVMTQNIKLAGLWRTLVFIPVTIPLVGSSIAWGAALQPDGPVNAIISALGGQPQPFFTSPSQALGSIIVLASWVGVGFWMLFLIAGVQAIPNELYEAARLDRAGPIRIFFQITVQQLRRPLLFVLVADTVANFVLFVPMQLLTIGGPEDSTTVLMYDAWRTTYTFGSRNLGAAEVVILTLIMLVFVLVQFRLLREDKESA
jgi:multiple sugar transport system permease protein